MQLVATPDRSPHLRHEFEQLACAVEVVAEAVRSLDRLGDVGDDAIAPPAHLVAEEPEASRRACANRTLRDDAALGAVGRADRRHLDHEPSLGHVHLERRVVEIATIAVFDPGRNPLEDAPVQADGVPPAPSDSQYRSTVAIGREEAIAPNVPERLPRRVSARWWKMLDVPTGLRR